MNIKNKMHNQKDFYLNLVFKKNPNIKYEKKDGRIVIIKKQNHWIQRLFRKLHFKIPEQTYITLDDYGSLVFEQIDGKKTVEEIGQILATHYEELNTHTHLYERLILYLNYLEKEQNWIIRNS